MPPERLRVDLHLVQPDVELRLHADDRHVELRALRELLLKSPCLGFRINARHLREWTARRAKANGRPNVGRALARPARGMPGARCRVPGAGSQVPGPRCRGPGTRYPSP